jgi:hypothetical protein
MSTNFNKKDGNISSTRNKLVKGIVSSSYSYAPTRGGITFTNRFMTTRLDKNGRLMSSGIKSGRNITYFDRNFKPINGISQF